MKLYRIEHSDSTRSLWYRKDGILDPYMDHLQEAMPMDFDPDFGRDGMRWFSAVYDYNELFKFLSIKELEKLFSEGFSLYKYETIIHRDKEWHPVFVQEGVYSKVLLDPSLVLSATLGEVE